MPAFFLDSSALVKRYVNEDGSGWISELVAAKAANQIYIARISGAEVAAALARRGIPKLAMTRFRNDFEAVYQIIEVGKPIIALAMRFAELHILRGYDAVQLAAASETDREYMAFNLKCTMVSADLELNRAAAKEGLLIENPSIIDND